MADYYDQAHCSYYGTCDLAAKLTAAALLTTTTPATPTHTILAQALTAADLAAACTSLRGQDASSTPWSRTTARSPASTTRPSSARRSSPAPADYQTYAGPIFGIDTNNGGMT